ncbi:D-alanyl-D-alanine carboxypeptidase/D-alanyl-D-alanine endopeptidase [Amycolatopsis alkalitolerans]|uniref:D-alanyl-D-alanine carboxypeptidase/D-alanyl-D-alanine-endopeptidase n=1 Tax=Amycolatopsis alkalitolerans TaxID=2547244 RepID=A0A5C4LS68_9PSEU|nr:D-alanyl-D-alanine carboxypeptidase/D-alanyl-D-alanine-endopeptidase [Amycolatopsis alkalitolerans]TNC21102.1 D-alanyl-D-alanine carboxypeptidase/D-alanyl-D-alanine-endopeptidase [Amycolatopsis alkalitolerans]
MPPHGDEPAWPSDDSDVVDDDAAGEGATGKSEQDTGATAQLKLPEQATVWVEPPKTEDVPAKPEPAAERTAFLPVVKSLDEPEAAKPEPAKPEAAAERTAFLPVVPSFDQPKTGEPKPEPPEERTAFLPVVQTPRPQPSDQVTAPQPLEQPTLFQPPPRPVPPAGIVHAQPMRIEPSGEVRPAEPVPQAEPTPPPPAEPPRRRRRGLLVGGAVVLVLVIAAGVAAATPYVSNRLGLPWAPNLPKGDTPVPAAVTLSLRPPSSSAPTPTAAGLSAALAGPAANGALGTLAGIVIDPATGQTLWNHDSSQLLTPASATKLLTTSAALLKLDPGFQISTKVVQGSSPDTAILVAGGDPTLSSLPDGQESIYPGAAHLDDLVAQVKKASGGAITKVQLDTSLYSGAQSGPGWAPEDTPSTYAVSVVPGMLDGGRSNPKIDEVARTADPGGTLLQTFAQRLGATAAGNATAPDGAKVLGEVRSAPLTELVANLLRISDNNLAEAVGRQTAIANGAPATFAGVAQTTLNVLAQNGFDVSGISINDGSGLSPMNKVPPKLLAQLLTVAAAPDNSDPRTAKLRPILAGLPVAGGSGTLADRFGDPSSSAGKGWVRAKTGTLSGVNTLAGEVLDKDGRVLVFAMMSNGSAILEARPALDTLAATLRGCGCR